MPLLVILIAIPMIRLLYRLVLVETGLGSIAYDRISHVLRNPLADVTLLVIAIVAVVTIMTERLPCSYWHHTTKTATRPRSGSCCARSGERSRSCSTHNASLQQGSHSAFHV
jgi:hypothetical protein